LAYSAFAPHDRQGPRCHNTKPADAAHALRFTPVPAIIDGGATEPIIVDRLAKDVQMASIDEEVRDSRVEIGWHMATECLGIGEQSNDLDLLGSDG